MRATSIAAMVKAEPKRGSNRQKVYQFILDCQERGATDQEMQASLNMSGDTLRPTRLSLAKDGMIYDSGKTRQNPNGNECIVWVASTVEQIGMF
jgi:hypothetical protein